MNRSVPLAAAAVVAAVVVPVVLTDNLAGQPDGGRDAPVPSTARQQSAVTGPNISPYTYVECRSGAIGDRLAGTVLHHADDDLDRAVELANLWISMVPDFPPGSDCHWECIVHGLNQTSCDPVYAPIIMPCNPETEEYICRSFECEPVWDGEKMHCGYYGNVTGHTFVITGGSWTQDNP